MHGVPRGAAPVHPSDVSRNVQAPLQTGRREDAFVAKLVKQIAAGLQILGIGAPNILFSDLLRRERRRRCGERLRG